MSYVHGQTPNKSVDYIDASGQLPSVNELIRDNGNGTISIGYEGASGVYIKGKTFSEENFESEKIDGDIVLQSPDGTRYRVHLQNGGIPDVTAV